MQKFIEDNNGMIEVYQNPTKENYSLGAAQQGKAAIVDYLEVMKQFSLNLLGQVASYRPVKYH